MTGFFVGGNRLTNFNLGFYFSFYATVHGAAIVSAVVSNRTGLTVAHSVNAGSFNTFVDQSLTYGVRTTLGQILVVGVGTDGVGVAFNSGGDRRVGTHELGQALDVLTELGANGVAVEVEPDNQLYEYGMQIRSRFRSRSGRRSRYRLSYYQRALAAAEVQTQTNPGLPFSVPMIQTMQHVQTGPD